MKTFAHYDSHGSVRALVTVNAPGQQTALLTPQGGHFVTEIEDLKFDPAKPDVAKLRKKASELRIHPTRSVRPNESK